MGRTAHVRFKPWTRGARRPRQWAGRSLLFVVIHKNTHDLHLDYVWRKGYVANRVVFTSGPRRGEVINACPVELSMKKVQLGATPGTGVADNLADRRSTLLSLLPNLLAHCCVVKYEDGSARKAGWFTVKTLGQTWIVQVKDPDSCCQLQCMAQSLDDALLMADSLLGSDAAPWENDPWQKRQASSKK